MKKEPIIKRILASFLLGIFLFAITPHEFIHQLLSAHQDTVDVVHHDMEVGSHHTHCDYLHIAHAPFSADFSVEEEPVPFSSCHLLPGVQPAPFLAFSEYFSLRAPPLS